LTVDGTLVLGSTFLDNPVKAHSKMNGRWWRNLWGCGKKHPNILRHM